MPGDRTGEDQRGHPRRHAGMQGPGLANGQPGATCRGAGQVRVDDADRQAHQREEPQQPPMIDAGAGGPRQRLQEGVCGDAGQSAADCCERQQPGETGHRITIFGGPMTSMQHPIRRMVSS